MTKKNDGAPGVCSCRDNYTIRNTLTVLCGLDVCEGDALILEVPDVERVDEPDRLFVCEDDAERVEVGGCEGVRVDVKLGEALDNCDGVRETVVVALVLRLRVYDGVGEQIILMALSHMPGYGEAADHVTPLSDDDQLPLAVAVPGSGAKFVAELETLCQLIGDEEERASAK